MHRFALTAAAALVSAAFTTAAVAQDKPAAPADSPSAGQRVQSPDKSNVQRPQLAAENMDRNAQRQTSRSTPAASGQSGSTGPAQQPVTAGEVRNWSAIDTNKDHLISPDEMESYLKQGAKKP